MSIITTIIKYSKNDLLKIPQNTFPVSSAQGIPTRRVSLLPPRPVIIPPVNSLLLCAPPLGTTFCSWREETVRRTTRLCGLSPVWPCRRSVPSAIVVEIRLSLRFACRWPTPSQVGLKSRLPRPQCRRKLLSFLYR